MTAIKADSYENLELLRVLEACSDSEVEVDGVCGQRYLACGWKNTRRLIVHGTAGNNLGAFAEGPEITVFGNAQDGVANTMSGGRIAIYGRAGDVLGYGMRGGEVYVRGDAGYRLGIHMKAYREQVPTIVVGGTVGAFAGEYMAGGTIVVLGMGMEDGGDLVGPYCGTGMYEGQIYLRGPYRPANIAPNVRQETVDADSVRKAVPELARFSELFGVPISEIFSQPFTRLSTLVARPFGRLYKGFVS